MTRSDDRLDPEWQRGFDEGVRADEPTPELAAAYAVLHDSEDAFYRGVAAGLNSVMAKRCRVAEKRRREVVDCDDCGHFGPASEGCGCAA